MFFKYPTAALALALVSTSTWAGFGPTQVVDLYKVDRIYQGGSAVFVTFTGPTIPGCSGNGGYLGPSWSEFNGGSLDNAVTSRMLSILLAAKAMGTEVEVRYHINDAGTGWNKCAISGIYMH